MPVIHENIEARNVKYLTKKLFEAARLDEKTDFLTNNKPDKENPFLDRFLDKLQEQLGSESFTDQNKSDLKESLSSQYNKLKEELNETRVFGVGKDNTEKAKTIASNCASIISKSVRGLQGLALDGAAALGFFTKTTSQSKGIRASLTNALKDNLGQITGAVQNAGSRNASAISVLKTTKIRFSKKQGQSHG